MVTKYLRMNESIMFSIVCMDILEFLSFLYNTVLFFWNENMFTPVLQNNFCVQKNLMKIFFYSFFIISNIAVNSIIVTIYFNYYKFNSLKDKLIVKLAVII